MDMAVSDDAWPSLLPDLLVDILRRLETTAVIRCAGTCKPWRRAIIGNASSLRPRPDRFNPNLLLGFFHHSWNEEVVDARSPPARVIVSVTAVDTGHCERLSSLIPGVDLLSSPHWILPLRDSFLLLHLCRGSIKSKLCLCNPMTRECTFLPQPSITEDCEYTLLSGYDLTSSGTRDEHGSVQILAKAGRHTLCTEEDRLTYQVFSYGGNGSAGIWGPLQHSDEVNSGLRMLTYGSNTVVSRDAVYWLAGPHGLGLQPTCTVGLDIYTGRAWSTELPSQCYYTGGTPYALTTSGNGRLSLLQPLPNDRQIQVWVLDGEGDAMEWTLQHKISVDVQNQPGDEILRSHYSNVVCPRSGFLFIMLYSSLQVRINLDSRERMPVQFLGKRSPHDYYPYEMDWPTYISNMKNF